MLSNITSWVKGTAEDLAVRVLQQGPIPKHIAFILDGNRRYARRQGMSHVGQGHRAGFYKMVEIVDYCIALGVKELTSYLFSIENFKRPEDEIDIIMGLVEEFLHYYVLDLHAKGARIEVVGNWPTTVPERIKSLFAHAMMKTRNNDKIKLNWAFSYTARNEIITGVNSLVTQVAKGTLDVSDIDEDALEQTFRITPSLPVDLLLRTSGETRLSDFLLWQITDAYLDFVDMEWPALRYRDFALSILRYQRHMLLKGKGKMRRGHSSPVMDSGAENRKRQAIELVRAETWMTVESIYNAEVAVN